MFKNLDLRNPVYLKNYIEDDLTIPFEKSENKIIFIDMYEAWYIVNTLMYRIEVEWKPSFSPDGKFVIFLVGDDENSKLYYQRKTKDYNILENYMKECLEIIDKLKLKESSQNLEKEFFSDMSFKNMHYLNNRRNLKLDSSRKYFHSLHIFDHKYYISDDVYHTIDIGWKNKGENKGSYFIKVVKNSDELLYYKEAINFIMLKEDLKKYLGENNEILDLSFKDISRYFIVGIFQLIYIIGDYSYIIDIEWNPEDNTNGNFLIKLIKYNSDSGKALNLELYCQETDCYSSLKEYMTECLDIIQDIKAKNNDFDKIY